MSKVWREECGTAENVSVPVMFEVGTTYVARGIRARTVFCGNTLPTSREVRMILNFPWRYWRHGRDNLTRKMNEAVRINNNKGVKLNSKAEYRQPRLAVCPQDPEKQQWVEEKGVWSSAVVKWTYVLPLQCCTVQCSALVKRGGRVRNELKLPQVRNFLWRGRWWWWGDIWIKRCPTESVVICVLKKADQSQTVDN